MDSTDRASSFCFDRSFHPGSKSLQDVFVFPTFTIGGRRQLGFMRKVLLTASHLPGHLAL
jgi:hypothetical protein